MLIEVATGAARTFSEAGNYRATPVWLDAASVAFLVEQQARPKLRIFDAATGQVRQDLPFSLASDPSFWGVFEALSDRRGGWLAVLERYESDLFRVTRD